jgi:hypothetical protein
MFFHRYEPTLAEVAVEGGLIGLVCFFALAGLLWLGRVVVDRLDRRADETTYTDDEEGER